MLSQPVRSSLRFAAELVAWLGLFAVAVLALAILAPPADATEKHDPKPPATSSPSQVTPSAASAGAAAKADAAASSTSAAQALGGAGGSSTSSADGGASDSHATSASSQTFQHRTSVLTMSTAEAVRIAPECWRPADRFGRPISTPLFALGGRVVRDDECWQERVKQAEHDRKMDELRLEIERDNAAAARDVAASQRVEAEQERARWVRK